MRRLISGARNGAPNVGSTEANLSACAREHRGTASESWRTHFMSGISASSWPCVSISRWTSSFRTTWTASQSGGGESVESACMGMTASVRYEKRAEWALRDQETWASFCRRFCRAGWRRMKICARPSVNGLAVSRRNVAKAYLDYGRRSSSVSAHPRSPERALRRTDSSNRKRNAHCDKLLRSPVRRRVEARPNLPRHLVVRPPARPERSASCLREPESRRTR